MEQDRTNLMTTFPAGMQAFLDVKSCKKAVPHEIPSGKVREFFIAAEEVTWDYAPSGKNRFTGDALTEQDR